MSNKFKYIKTKFKDLLIIKYKKNQDERGFFSKLYDEKEFKKINISKIIQINFSENFKKGTLRGMHYQKKPYEEEKIIKCISGSVYDVVIDLRKNSKTYLMTFSYNLKNDNTLIFIPRGFAHGFQSLENNTLLMYLHGNIYRPKHQRGILFDSKIFNINWPIKKKIISQRDKNFPDLDVL